MNQNIDNHHNPHPPDPATPAAVAASIRCVVEACPNARDSASKGGEYCASCWDWIKAEAPLVAADVNETIRPAKVEPEPLTAPTVARLEIKPEPKHDPKPEPTPQRAMVKADEKGLLKPTSIEEAYRLAQYMHKSGMFEARYKSPEMLMVAMQFALELGLKPMTALRQMAVIKGTPAIFGDLPLSMVISSGNLRKHREWWFDKDGVELPSWHPDVYGSGCYVWRRGEDESDAITRFFTLDMARKAQLTGGKPYEPWQAYTFRMLQMRGRSHALKDKFPDTLNGIAIGEYDYHTTIDAIATEVQGQLSKADELTARLKQETAT